MLGHPDKADAGIVELVVWDGTLEPAPEISTNPRRGVFLMCFYVDVEDVAERLQGLGYEPNVFGHEANGNKIRMATIHDPDGVLIELVQFVEGGPVGYTFDK
jgi:catechol 2,3-dioxygenase-like lactoylglutathione lyase family enzyme